MPVKNGFGARLRTFSGTATTTWADSGSTSDSYTDTYDDVGDGWSYKETSGMTSKDKWSYSYTLNHAIQSDGSWQATSGSGGSEGSGSWTWSYNGGGNYWPAAPDEELCGEFTDEGADTTTYEYETTATYSDGKWHETGTGQVSDSGHTHYTYEGEGSFSSDDGDGSQNEKGYERTEYSATVDYTFTEGHWNYASGTADYSEKWSDRWDYSVTDLSGDIETKGWDEAYEKYDEDYTLDTERGRWQMTDVGVRGNGEYGYRQTTTNPIPYTAGGTHDGNDWSVEGTYTANQGGGVEYAYWGEALNTLGFWTYDGNGWKTKYTTSGSSYSGSGEYGIDDEEVNGSVTAQGGEQFRSDRTTDYVLDSNGAWQVDQYRRAILGEVFSKWSYSLPDSGRDEEGDDWCEWDSSEGETHHAAFEYYRGYESESGQDWVDDVSRSYIIRSVGKSTDSSYSGTGSYHYDLSGDTIGSITGTFGEDRSHTCDVTYTEHSTLNADGSWATPTVSRTVLDTAQDNWAYEGEGEYTRSGYAYSHPYDFDGTINEYGSDSQTVRFEATTIRGADGAWSASGNGKGSVLRDSESGYSYSNSGDLEWQVTSDYEDEIMSYSSFRAYYFHFDEDGSGSSSSHDAEYWNVAGGEWSSTGAQHFAIGSSEESLSFQEGFEGDYYYYQEGDIQFGGPVHEHKSVSTETFRHYEDSGDGSEWSTVSGQGTATWEYRTVYPNALWQTLDDDDHWVMEADGDNVRWGSHAYQLFDLEADSYSSESSQPGFDLEQGYCAPFDIGYTPLSGHAGTQSHSPDDHSPPSVSTVGSDGTSSQESSAGPPAGSNAPILPRDTSCARYPDGDLPPAWMGDASANADSWLALRESPQNLTPVARAELVEHCNGDAAMMSELETILSTWYETAHTYGPGGFCGSWLRKFLARLPEEFLLGQTTLKIKAVWFKQLSPRLLTKVGGFLAFGGVPGHYAAKLTFPDGYVVYLDNGWAGTEGIFTFVDDGHVPKPKKDISPDWVVELEPCSPDYPD